MKDARIYLAGPSAWHPRLRMYANELRAMGMTVTSRWLDEDPSVLNGEIDRLSDKYCADVAFRDVQDIAACNIFVLFTPTEDELDNPEISKKSWARGSRHYELGISSGLRLLNAALSGMINTYPFIIVCGPRENIFHAQEHIERFDNWDLTLSRILRIAHEDCTVGKE